jgi:DNA-binding MarR family transcriptional regulator
MSVSPKPAAAKDEGPPSEGGYLIAKAHQIGGRVFSRLLKEAGGMDINPSQGRILFALWKEKRMRIAELARETALEPSTLTSMLDRLEAAGLATRSPSIEDRRALVVECTAAGRALMSRYSSASEKMTELFYGDMKAEEIAAFESTLKRIVGNLSRAEDQLSQ